MSNPKILKEITEELEKEDNELYLLENKLREVGIEWVNHLEKEAEEYPQLFMKNAVICGWIMKFFSINKEGVLV